MLITKNKPYRYVWAKSDHHSFSEKKKSHKTKPRDRIHLEKLKNIPGILILRNAFHKSYIFHGSNPHMSAISRFK